MDDATTTTRLSPITIINGSKIRWETRVKKTNRIEGVKFITNYNTLDIFIGGC